MDMRKTVTIIEDTLFEGDTRLAQPLRRAAIIAVVRNPLATRNDENHGELIHDGEDLGRYLAQRSLDFVDRGRIVREGATQELRSGGKPSFRAEVVADETAARAALASAGIALDGVSRSNGRLELRWTADDAAATNTRALRALLDAGAQVVTLNAETRTLEDAYLAIIKESRQ